MSTKPILFSTPMVQAILEDRKSKTRRVIPEKIVDEYYDYDEYVNAVATGVPHIRDYEDAFFKKKARYQPGDVLWVRETWCNISDWTCVDPSVGLSDGFIYKADWHARLEHPRWRPSIYMPKEAARVFLRVTGVRVERVQDIGADDAYAEGYHETEPIEHRPRSWFSSVWDARNAKRGYGWDKNPYVWVYSFERVDKPAGWPGGDKGAEQ